MTQEKTAERWAFDLSILLRTVMGEDRFPIDIEALALDYSQKKFPDDPITRIRERDTEDFEGFLIPHPGGKPEWGIGYASSIESDGRRRFTIAHEFGHYLIHREKYPNGFQCRPEDMAAWDSEYNRLEAEANQFAANLLLPRDDFRLQIDPKAKVDLDTLGRCAERYGVSLMAATLRWLSFTQRRALLVVSREGYILWARSSTPAFKSGAYIKSSVSPPVPVPDESPIVLHSMTLGLLPAIQHPERIWLSEPVEEHALVSKRYDLGLSLLLLGNLGPIAQVDEADAPDLLEGQFKFR